MTCAGVIHSSFHHLWINKSNSLPLSTLTALPLKLAECCALSWESLSHFFSLLLVNNSIGVTHAWQSAAKSGFRFSGMERIWEKQDAILTFGLCVFFSLFSEDLSHCTTGFLVFPWETLRLLFISPVFSAHVQTFLCFFSSCWTAEKTSFLSNVSSFPLSGDSLIWVMVLVLRDDLSVFKLLWQERLELQFSDL